MTSRFGRARSVGPAAIAAAACLLLVACGLPAPESGVEVGVGVGPTVAGSRSSSEVASGAGRAGIPQAGDRSDAGSSAATVAGDPALGPWNGVIVAEAVGPTVVARTAPDDDASAVATLANPTAFGGPLVFQAVDPVHRPEREWIEVLLPVRPNGTTGWVRNSEVELSRNPFRIEIDTGDHRLRVFRGGELWTETAVAIGTGSTPTPIGDFYIIELLQPPDPGGSYGPFAFGLSGFSETLTEFAGGDGVIGIHGTNEPSALGSDVSHGCVRVANDVIDSLAGVLPLGTPVSIDR